MTSKCEICLETYTEDQLVSVGDCERFNRKKEISVVCSNCYDKDDCERCGEYDYEGDLCDTCNMCKDEHSCCECEVEPWCYENSTRDTIENDRCICSVGNCSMPTFIEHLTDKEYISHLEEKVEELEGKLKIAEEEDYAEEDYTEERCDTCKKVLTYGDEQGCDCCSYCDTIKLMDSTERENTDPKPVMYKGEWICYACYDEADKCGCGKCGEQIDLTVVILVI